MKNTSAILMFSVNLIQSQAGLFAEGWLKDLYLESASALVINPDGKIYAAWVVPDSDVINYKSSDKDAP